MVKHQRRTTLRFLDIDSESADDDPAEEEADQFAVETLFPADVSRLIFKAKSRQDLVLLAAHLGIGVAVVAGRYANLTDNWKVASTLRGKITDADITKLEKLVAEDGS